MNPLDAQNRIAKRIARELRPGMLVNLGIGIPTLVANYIPRGMHVHFQSENGVIGTGPVPEAGMSHPPLTDAGGRPVGALPGASTFDSAVSFGLIRGGHVDVTVLGGLQVDANGRLANWMIPGKILPGMGGAMDLVTGAKRVIVGMQHSDNGRPKIVPTCTLPLTSIRSVDLVVTELAVICFRDGRATLLEVAPDVSIEQILAATPIHLNICGLPTANGVLRHGGSASAKNVRRTGCTRRLPALVRHPTSKALDMADASIAQRRERRDLCELLALGNERQEHAKPNAACR